MDLDHALGDMQSTEEAEKTIKRKNKKEIKQYSDRSGSSKNGAVRLRPLVFEDFSNGASGRSKRIVFCFTGFTTHHSLTLFMLFDHVFDETSTHGFYELLAKDIIHAVLNGFNGMFLIYEQI
ncbi:kinesin-like protein KIN-7N isoform X2 [Arachis ipaensis]|nr:kinesin-like protein KIN-7N isoform X2 [Arachis ipaensis]XP_025626627.1 kinesin-like protein KIN-7N isoform X2 [Arachis hypogaea]